MGWQIREESLYQAQCARIEPDVRRMDEILAGCMWGFAQNPYQGFPISGTRLWLLKTDAFPGAPRLRIWYRFDESIVYLLSIEAITDDD